MSNSDEQSRSPISWGIIGCGNVTEVKSGSAFNKVSDSTLAAVMRRDGEKAKDYALRHKVPKWYNAVQLIDDPHVKAIYIATPRIALLAAALPRVIIDPSGYPLLGFPYKNANINGRSDASRVKPPNFHPCPVHSSK